MRHTLGIYLVLSVALCLAAACGPAPQTAEPVVIVAETGGMQLPPLVGDNGGVDANLEPVTEPLVAGEGDEVIVVTGGGEPILPTLEPDAPATIAPPTEVAPTVEPPLLVTGQQVSVIGSLRLYADADPDSLTLDEYNPIAIFVVVEPTADFARYPVEINGVRWYRVRAEDGLVGWVMADGVNPVKPN